MPLLCFDIEKNGRKLALAGVRESGVVTVILTWVGKGRDASARAAEAEEEVPGLTLHIGGIDSSDPGGDAMIEWIDSGALRLGDQLSIRIAAADGADPPAKRSKSQPPARREADATFIECSFCGERRRSDSGKAGVAGPQVFICARCAVLSERLLDDGLAELFHLKRSEGATCSFCGAERTADSVAARGREICRSCVDLAAKEVLFP
jgi:hypothetical protein